MALVKICPTCSKPNPIEAKYCYECGVDITDVEPVEEKVVETYKICRNCGMKNKATNKFCVSCMGTVFIEKKRK